MMRAPITFSAAVALAFILSSCSSGTPQVEVGQLAPDFSATDLAAGRVVSLGGDYRGSVTLVNVWATYCGPCREEVPTLQKLYEEFGSKGLRIAAVSIDDDSASVVTAFMKGFGVTFDVLHDPKNSIQAAYHSEKIPESFLIDRHGRIVRIDYGARDWTSEGMQRLVSSLLAESPP